MLPDRNFFFRLADAAKAETLPRFRTGIAVDNKQAGGYDPVTEGDQAAGRGRSHGIAQGNEARIITPWGKPVCQRQQ